MTNKRQRFQFKFWLDVNKPHELKLGVALEEAKKGRGYSALIRDALNLFLDLRSGRTDVLRAMFPSIVRQIENNVKDSPANVEFARLIERQTAILEKLTAASATAMVGSSTAFNAPKFGLPTYEDEELPTLEIKRDTSSNSANNFLNSLSALTGSGPTEARANFASGMGNLFADDEEF